jgi:hypothetical protein
MGHWRAVMSRWKAHHGETICVFFALSKKNHPIRMLGLTPPSQELHKGKRMSKISSSAV